MAASVPTLNSGASWQSRKILLSAAIGVPSRLFLQFRNNRQEHESECCPPWMVVTDVWRGTGRSTCEHSVGARSPAISTKAVWQYRRSHDTGLDLQPASSGEPSSEGRAQHPYSAD